MSSKTSLPFARTLFVYSLSKFEQISARECVASQSLCKCEDSNPARSEVSTDAISGGIDTVFLPDAISALSSMHPASLNASDSLPTKAGM